VPCFWTSLCLQLATKMRLHPIALGDHDNTNCVSVCARRRTPAWRVHRLLWTSHIVLLCVLPTCCRGGGGGGPTPGGQGVIQNEGEGRGLAERWFAKGLRLTGRRGKAGTQYACAANSPGEDDDEDQGGRQGETRVESNDSGSQRNREEAVERVHATGDGAGSRQAPTALKEAFYSRLSGEDNLWGALARRPVTKVNVYGVGSFAAPQRHPLGVSRLPLTPLWLCVSALSHCDQSQRVCCAWVAKTEVSVLLPHTGCQRTFF